jgi:Flp pilus assembly pilin Flp
MISYVKTILFAAMQDRKGVTALEYGVLAVAVIGAVAAAATVLSGDISSAFSNIGTKLGTNNGVSG